MEAKTPAKRALAVLDTAPMQQPIIKWGVLAQGGDGGVGNRTSFVPETGEKTRHRLRTDERQCIENAAESSDMSNERLEVSLNPNHRQPDDPGAL
jgi:hypothetical protein